MRFLFLDDSFDDDGDDDDDDVVRSLFGWRGKNTRRVPMVWLIATVAFSRSDARAVTTQVVGNIKTCIIRYRLSGLTG